MDRELLLVTLTLALCGPALLGSGLVTAPQASERNAYRLERLLWIRLWLGLLPAALLFGLLLGWALQEPDESDERVSVALVLTILPFAGIWLRAFVRAVVALRHRHAVLAGTIGILRPRVIIAPALTAELDDSEVAAVRAHEEAHSRHFDPARVWLAQFLTDLQGPFLGASRRFLEWRKALEIARDAEAMAMGAEGADLASAIVIAVRIERIHRRPGALVQLTPEDDIRDRIGRLLEPVPEPVAPARSWPLALAFVALVLIALIAGRCFGEALVRSLPGVIT